jgi:hypothetical protein
LPGVFTAENATVEIYRDDGTGSPSGSALFTAVFRRAVAASLEKTYEYIPHAGYPTDEVSLGQTRCLLNLSKMVEGRARDLKLTDALYYIRVILHTDDYSGWDRYNCSKCRRINWEINQGDRGPIISRARFLAENVVSEAV